MNLIEIYSAGIVGRLNTCRRTVPDPKAFHYGCRFPDTTNPLCSACQIPEGSTSHQGVPASNVRNCVDIATTSFTLTPKFTEVKRSVFLILTNTDLAPTPIVSRKPCFRFSGFYTYDINNIKRLEDDSLEKQRY